MLDETECKFCGAMTPKDEPCKDCGYDKNNPQDVDWSSYGRHSPTDQ